MTHFYRIQLQRIMLCASSQRVSRLALAATIAATLVACGGGSDGSTAPGDNAPALAIVTQPADSQVTAGGPAQFSIVTAGQGQAVQWQRSADAGVTWQDITGATSATLRLASVSLADNGQLIRAVVMQGNVVLPSTAVRLTVTATIVAPSISIAPTDLTATAGTDASFTTTATGTSLAYQWQRSSNGSDWTDISGQTQPTLTLTAVPLDSNGTQVRVVVSNSAGSLTSSPARLSVQAASAMPSISSQPGAVSVVAPAAATFTVMASGQPTPSYQWQRSTDGGATYVDIAGATSASFTTGPTSLANDGERFRVQVSNSAGSVVSQAQPLTVTAAQVAPTIGQQPQDQSVAAGQTATLTSAASGTPSPTLQWQVSLDGGNSWANINGATGSSYAFTASAGDSGRRYRVVATNSKGSVSSRGALLTVQPAASALANRSWSIGQRWFGPDAAASGMDQSLASAGLALGAKSAIDQQGRITTIFAQLQGAALRLSAIRTIPSVNGATQVSAPVVIDTGAPADLLAGMTLAISPAGNVVAGWSHVAPCTTQTYSSQGKCNYIYTARYLAASGQWQAPVLLTDTPTPTDYSLAINDAGDLLAVYYSVKPTVTDLEGTYSALAWRSNSQSEWQRSTYDLGSGFVPRTIQLDAAGHFSTAGTKVQPADPKSNDVAVVRGSMTSGAGPIELLDQRAATAVLDGLFSNSAGQQVLMWHQDNGVRVSQYAATLDTPTGVWQVKDLGVLPQATGPLLGALAEDGSFQWYSFSTLRCSTQRRIGGVWGLETPLPAALCVGTPQTAIARNGDVLVVRTSSTTAGQWLTFDARLQEVIHSPAATPIAADYLFGMQGTLSGSLLLANNGIGAFVSLNKYDVFPTPAAPNGDSRGIFSIWGHLLK